MGHGALVKRGLLRGQWHHHCSPTSTCTTSSTSGPSNGGGAKPTATLSSCAMPMTSLSASSTKPMRGGSGMRCERGSSSSGSSFTGRRPGCWSSVAMRRPAPATRAWQTGDLRVPGVHVHLRQVPARGLSAPAQDQGRPHASETAGDQGPAAKPHARRHPRTGAVAEGVVTGYFAYHAVPTNMRSLETFRHHVTDLWRRTLRRRSQKDGMNWDADDADCRRMAARTPYPSSLA